MPEDNPYIGEIRLFGGAMVPSGWAYCNGQQLSISGNETLYLVIGTTFGGDGQTYFNLPDLRCRVPVHWGANHPVGEVGGQEQVILTEDNLPAHSHIVQAATAGGSDDPAGNTWGVATDKVFSSVTAPVIGMSPGGLSTSGGGNPHDNMIPYVAVSYIIALVGIYPSPPDEEPQ